MGNLFEDIRERFLRINDKLVEFINIQNEREDEIKVMKMKQIKYWMSTIKRKVHKQVIFLYN